MTIATIRFYFYVEGLFPIVAGPAGFALLHLRHADPLIFFLCDVKAVVAIGALEAGIHGMRIMPEYDRRLPLPPLNAMSPPPILAAPSETKIKDSIPIRQSDLIMASPFASHISTPVVTKGWFKL